MKVKKVDVKGAVLFYAWADKFSQEFDVSSLPKEIILAAATDRIRAKMEDAHADRQERGVEWCREQTNDVWAALCDGAWDRGRGTGTPWLIEALVAAFPKAIDAEKAREIYDDEDSRKKAYKLPEVKKWKAEHDLAQIGDAKPTDVTKLF